jgi:hypothetical protein
MILKELVDFIEEQLKNDPKLGEKNVSFTDDVIDYDEEDSNVMELVNAGTSFMNRSEVETAIESCEPIGPVNGTAEKEYAVLTFKHVDVENNSHKYTLNDALNSFKKISSSTPEKLGFDTLFYLDGEKIDYSYCFADFDMEILYDEDLDLVYFQAIFS